MPLPYHNRYHHSNFFLSFCPPSSSFTINSPHQKLPFPIHKHITCPPHLLPLDTNNYHIHKIITSPINLNSIPMILRYIKDRPQLPTTLPPFHHNNCSTLAYLISSPLLSLLFRYPIHFSYHVTSRSLNFTYMSSLRASTTRSRPTLIRINLQILKWMQRTRQNNRISSAIISNSSITYLQLTYTMTQTTFQTTTTILITNTISTFLNALLKANSVIGTTITTVAPLNGPAQAFSPSKITSTVAKHNHLSPAIAPSVDERQQTNNINYLQPVYRFDNTKLHKLYKDLYAIISEKKLNILPIHLNAAAFNNEQHNQVNISTN